MKSITKTIDTLTESDIETLINAFCYGDENTPIEESFNHFEDVCKQLNVSRGWKTRDFIRIEYQMRKNPKIREMIDVIGDRRIFNTLRRYGYTSIEEIRDGLKSGELQPHALRNYGDKLHTDLINALSKSSRLDGDDLEVITGKHPLDHRMGTLYEIRKLVKIYSFTQDEIFSG